MLITLDNEQIEVEPQAVNGLGLRCKIPAGPHMLETSLLVFDYQAVDREAFWAAWERLGGAGQGLVWESGEPFKAPLQCPSDRPKSRKRALPGLLKWVLGWFFEV